MNKKGISIVLNLIWLFSGIWFVFIFFFAFPCLFSHSRLDRWNMSSSFWPLDENLKVKPWLSPKKSKYTVKAKLEESDNVDKSTK